MKYVKIEYLIGKYVVFLVFGLQGVLQGKIGGFTDVLRNISDQSLSNTSLNLVTYDFPPITSVQNYPFGQKWL